MNFGGDQTNSEVIAIACPSWFLAVHSYGPVSFLSAASKANDPSL